MSVYKVARDLQLVAINTPTVMQSAYGDIELYNNKSNIKYPYVNFDVVSENVIGSIAQYTFRIYIVDRNEDPYVAYNKTKLILDSIMKYYSIDVANYVANFFTLNFKDLINGCWCDFTYEEPLEIECLIDDITTSGFTISDNMLIYELTENLVDFAKNINMVEGADKGTIEIYENKSNIKYPYVNIDLINSITSNNSNKYTFRIYSMDRNYDPYVAYNKTELILNNIVRHPLIDANNYTINFFTLNFKDIVNGCWCDIRIETNVAYNCLSNNDQNTYIITEDGDFIVTEQTQDYIIKE